MGHAAVGRPPLFCNARMVLGDVVLGVPILDARANELGAQDWVYDWAETVWDAMPFLGLQVMPCTDSILVVLITLLNVGVSILLGSYRVPPPNPRCPRRE